MARVLGLLPFFVLGLVSTTERLERLREPWVRNAALLVFLAIAVVTTWTDQLAQTEWLYYRSQYGELDVSDGRALLTRAVLLVIGCSAPGRSWPWSRGSDGWFTRMGAATLVVYLFHGFAIKGAEYAGSGLGRGPRGALAAGRPPSRRPGSRCCWPGGRSRGC